MAVYVINTCCMSKENRALSLIHLSPDPFGLQYLIGCGNERCIQDCIQRILSVDASIFFQIAKWMINEADLIKKKTKMQGFNFPLNSIENANRPKILPYFQSFVLSVSLDLFSFYANRPRVLSSPFSVFWETPTSAN